MDESFLISRDYYNNLLPVLRKHLLERQEQCFFIGTPEQFKDAMRRCAFID